MKNDIKPKLSAYLSAPLSIAMGFLLVVLFFIFVMKDASAVPVFITVALIQIIAMTMFGLLPDKHKRKARMTSMFLIGTMLFLFAGIFSSSNLQIEGFFFYLLSGTLSGVIVHYCIAKVFGPIFFSRNWCGWGCWSAMIFDLLPYKKTENNQAKMPGYYRYIHFALSFATVAFLFFVVKYAFVQTDAESLKNSMGTTTELIWFLVGNALYYATGIILAIKFKDNRAFCKYLCPIAPILKASSRFTILRIKGDNKSCTNCGTCSENCPMGINIPEYVKANSRVKSTECIMCMKCIAVCPQAILRTSIR